jgi:hypothetical protein
MLYVTTEEDCLPNIETMGYIQHVFQINNLLSSQISDINFGSYWFNITSSLREDHIEMLSPFAK